MIKFNIMSMSQWYFVIGLCGLWICSAQSKQSVKWKLSDIDDIMAWDAPSKKIVDIKKPEIYYLHIKSDISYRFSTTTVTSLLANRAKTPTEAQFHIVLPNSAFITRFVMVIDGKEIEGDVKEKQKAKREYEKAKAKGQSAGVVSAKRETNAFGISVNVAGQKKVNFTLEYQELLQRKLGVYENVIHIQPGNIVNDLKVDVYIDESRNITKIHVPPLKSDLLQQTSLQKTKVNKWAVIDRLGPTSAHISYHPSSEVQRKHSEKGIAGQFIVQYDVVRDMDAGDVEVVDGYFVHYIAPEGLPPIDKNVLFILDTSGSMLGRKMRQVKQAMNKILADLRPGDLFNIVSFDSGVDFWNDHIMVKSTEKNKKDAIEFVRRMKADGGTNINDALVSSVNFLKKQQRLELLNPTSLIIFLTDGHATSGIRDPSHILKNIERANLDIDSPVFSLSFGKSADYDFLKQMSLQNSAISRKIYEDSDADLQLEGFYDEISTPLLNNVTVNYLGDAVDTTTLTQTSFKNYFNGSELIVAGKLKEGITFIRNLSAAVSGSSQYDDLVLDLLVDLKDAKKKEEEKKLQHFTERLWAYLTIKSMLDKKDRSANKTEKDIYKEKALNLSLKYSFVTPLTSMIVVKPDGEEIAKDAKKIEQLKEDLPVVKSATGSYKPVLHSATKRISTVRNNPVSARPGRFADNDPHFIVAMYGSNLPICFDVNGNPDDIFQLIYDEPSGIVVNGQVIASKRRSKSGKIRTYFGKIALMGKGVSIIVKPKVVYISRQKIRWTKHPPAEIYQEDVRITMNRKNITVYFSDHLVLTVVRHLVRRNHPLKRSFLGFYIDDSLKLTPRVHGLMGQFEYQRVHITKVSNTTKQGGTIAKLNFLAPRTSKRSVPVYLRKRRNLATKEDVPCWHVRHNGRWFLDGVWQDYRVPKLIYDRFPNALFKKVHHVFSGVSKHFGPRLPKPKISFGN